MKVKVNLKQIGQRKQKIAPVDFEYANTPKTVRELIEFTAAACVSAYNQRVRAGESGIKPLSSEEIIDMADIGKVAFGINYGEKEQDLKKAEENALQSYQDGLYRIFVNEEKLSEDINSQIVLKEGDSLTFIKLTMLAGRMW